MRLGLSDEALKREATEAARGSRRERHLKVLERRQEQQQQAKEEAEGAKKEAQSIKRISQYRSTLYGYETLGAPCTG